MRGSVLLVQSTIAHKHAPCRARYDTESSQRGEARRGGEVYSGKAASDPSDSLNLYFGYCLKYRRIRPSPPLPLKIISPNCIVQGLPAFDRQTASIEMSDTAYSSCLSTIAGKSNQQSSLRHAFCQGLRQVPDYCTLEIGDETPLNTVRSE